MAILRRLARLRDLVSRPSDLAPPTAGSAAEAGRAAQAKLEFESPELLYQMYMDDYDRHSVARRHREAYGAAEAAFRIATTEQDRHAAIDAMTRISAQVTRFQIALSMAAGGVVATAWIFIRIW